MKSIRCIKEDDQEYVWRKIAVGALIAALILELCPFAPTMAGEMNPLTNQIERQVSYHTHLKLKRRSRK